MSADASPTHGGAASNKAITSVIKMCDIFHILSSFTGIANVNPTGAKMIHE
jgi:hypothetical protein